MLPAENIQHHIGGIRSRADHFGHRYVGHMAVIAAFGAAETAQMAVSYIVILVFGLAVDAIRRVRQFVRGLLVDRHVDTEPDHLIRDLFRK